MHSPEICNLPTVPLKQSHQRVMNETSSPRTAHAQRGGHCVLTHSHTQRNAINQISARTSYPQQSKTDLNDPPVQWKP